MEDVREGESEEESEEAREKAERDTERQRQGDTCKQSVRDIDRERGTRAHELKQ